MKTLLLSTIAFSLVCCPIKAALGDLILQFEDDGGAKTSFDIVSGGTKDISVYLLQNNPENRLVTHGLISMGLKLSYSDSPGFASVLAANIGTGFEVDANESDSTSRTLIGSPDIGDPAVKANGNRILLGTFTFLAGAEGNLTSVSVLDPSAFNENVLDGNPGVSIDNDIFGSSGLSNAFAVNTIAAVPEPSSAMLILTTLPVMLLRTRRG